MTQINASVIIKKPIDKVFAFVSDFENDTQWWLGVKESRLISDIKHGVGARYWQLSYFIGMRNETTFEIIECQSPSRLTLRSLKSAIPFVAHYTLEPTTDGTRFTMQATVQWVGFYRLLKPLFSILLRRVAKQFFYKLKQVMEAKP